MVFFTVGETNNKDQTTSKQGKEAPVGGTNDKDQTTGKQGEDPPEQPEYRAYFNQSQQQPYVFQTGANDVPVYFTLNIYALGARFGDVSKDDVSFNRMNGNAIKFLFNVAVNVIRNADRDCTELFEDVSKLGKGATCDMTTPWSLLVTIGGGTNLIKSGDILIFKQDTFKPARQMFYRTFPARNFSIQAPNTQQRLSFTITGPTRINSCGNYQLRAEQISGHGGRPVTYQWQLWNESIPYGLNEGNQSPEVSINAAGILPGNYSVSLNITNFLQQVKLEAVLTFSFGDDCKTTGDVPKYEWSSSGDIIIPEELSKNRILVLPPNTLPVGTNIHITVSVSLTGAKGPTTVTEDIQLTTVSSPLVAQIIGASILTLGPDETASSENSCNSYLKSPLTLPELSITSSQFTEGTYSIILTVSKDTSTRELRRTAFVSATLVIVNDRVPVITINATGCVADPDLEPLTYQPVFALPVKSGFKKIVLGGSKSDSEQRVIASPINYNEGQVYVGFMICDASSTCIDEFHITDYVPAKEITPSEQQEYITHNVDEVLERGDIATAFRNVINIANLLKKTSLPTRRRRRDTEVQFTFQGNLDSVFLVVNGQTVQVNGNDAETQFKIELAGKQAMVFFSVRPVDVNEGALVSDLSSQMMISMFTEEEIDEVLRTIRRILDKARDEGALYSKDTIERNLREMALKQAGQHLNIDEHVTFDVLGTQMFVAYSFPKHEVTLTNDSVHRVNARLGRNLSNRNLCGHKDEQLSDLEEPIEIEMAMNQVGKDERCVCKCWNEDTSQLEDDGVTSETTADGKLICKSRRPATFVGARELNSSADRREGRQRAGIPKLQKRHPGVILGIVFGILLLIIVAVAIAVMVLKANAKKKVSPAGKKFEEEKSDISEADNP
ncbi:hypothetical protein HOLleu_00338 [Holothuria leucospilota]|uniref:PKD/REJ-like domain-containing protein n=1 Tax=Holothuria leucospilota TaxID=206669 RepID=A0A9Q1HK69_HOLLE|nr:hypothetical protein HOLleu_00338 [Holothuria leucospilota]